jgi:hypothetical protein
MMLQFLAGQSLNHLNSITHEGKTLIFGIDRDSKIWYTVKQDGFEDSFLSNPSRGWENWKILELPKQPKDLSVINYQAENLTYQAISSAKTTDSQFILQSVYDSQDMTAIGPVQIISGLGHLYVFRQSKAGTLLVDRFILDGMTNTLKPKLEVRYKRSKLKYEPLNKPKAGSGEKAAMQFDSLDFRDATDQFFYEPTTELCLIKNLIDGWFSIVLMSTSEKDGYRWHIFAYNQATENLELTSIRASEEGLFDVQDRSVPLRRSNPNSGCGIIQQIIKVKGVKLLGNPVATRYSLQSEQQTETGKRLMRGAIRVMLVMPTDQGNTAALNFSVDEAGLLSELEATTTDSLVLRSKVRQVLLSPNTLDEIKAIAPMTAVSKGTITSIGQAASREIKLTSEAASQLQVGSTIKVENTADYDGAYAVRKIDDYRFEIVANWKQSRMGSWEVIPTEAEKNTVISDNSIVKLQQGSGEKLVIECAQPHGLDTEETVQISGSVACNGTYAVKQVEAQAFTIEAKTWKGGEAVNLQVKAKKRRGIVFDGEKAYIDVDCPPLAQNTFTIEAWVFPTKEYTLKPQSDTDASGTKDQRYAIYPPLRDQGATVGISVGTNGVSIYEHAAKHMPAKIVWKSTLSTWTHLAVVYRDKKPSLYVNGIRVAEGTVSTQANVSPSTRFGGGQYGYFCGQMAEVRIWNTARSEVAIQGLMHLPLIGEEMGLVGYWKLGAIVEGKTRTVVDFSVLGHDGTVSETAMTSEIQYRRTLADNKTLVSAYVNEELFAVTQGATYEESFEFKVDTKVNLTEVKNQIFKLKYWGRESRDSENIDIEANSLEITRSSNEGWYRALGRFQVPDKVKLVRSFGLSEVTGDWKTIDIRQHKIVLTSDQITKYIRSSEVELKTLGTSRSVLVSKMGQRLILVSLLREREQFNKNRDQLSKLLNQKKFDLCAEQLESLKRETPELHKSLKNEQGKLQLSKLLNQEKFDLCVALEALKELEEKTPELDKKLKNEQENRFNYWCSLISCNFTNDDAISFLRDGDYHLTIRGASRSKKPTEDQLFKFSLRDKGYFTITSSREEKCLQHNYHREGSFVFGNSFKDDERTQLWKPKIQPSSDFYLIESAAPFFTFLLGMRHIELPTDGSIPRTEAVVESPQKNYASDPSTYHWKIISSGKPSNAAIPDAEQAIKDNTAAILGYKTAIIAAIETKIATLNSELLTLAQKAQTSPQVMSGLSNKDRNLVTTGALLEFILPASRLSAIETCDGNVQLSYFDPQGRVRQTYFDATADSRNPEYEVWKPDSVPVCLNLEDSKSLIQITPTQAVTEWTIEAWFFYPFPADAKKAVLACGNKEQHVAFQCGDTDNWLLGTLLNEAGFVSSGYNLSSLAKGWHYISVVGQGEKETSVTTFYIDGKKVGDTNQIRAELLKNKPSSEQKKLQARSYKASSPISTLGNDENGNQSLGKLAEVRLWSIALSPEEIAVNSKIILSGNEPGLFAYYPMNDAKNDAKNTIVNRVSPDPAEQIGFTSLTQNQTATIVGKYSWCVEDIPIGCPTQRVLSFNSKTDFVETTCAPLAENTFTIEAWVLPTVERKSVPLNTVGTDSQCYAIAPKQQGTNAGIGISVGTNGVNVYEHGASHMPAVLVWDSPYPLLTWTHIALVYKDRVPSLYVDGEFISKGTASSKPKVFPSTRFGSGEYGHFPGQIAEIRIWTIDRTATEIKRNMNQIASDKANLAGHWLFSCTRSEGSTSQVIDQTGRNHANITGTIVTDTNTLPLVGDSVVTTEYSAISIDPTTNKQVAMMRRLLTYSTVTGEVEALPDQRIEHLDLAWIGNAQLAPTLLGYIEGAPPIPSENLTESDNYNGATSIQVSASEDMKMSWSRSQDGSIGAHADLFLGLDAEITVGFLVMAKLVEARAGAKANLDLNYGFQNASRVAAQSSMIKTDRLELRGACEQSDPKFPILGNRFVPKNVGYALVISSLADVFITRLKRSQRMVSYDVRPIPDIPPDINTITFMINPAYIMNGSLDGMTGSAVTSNRFFKNVAELRSQYGGLYPASYYRLREAYSLKQQIDNEDKRRESYFANFDSLSVDETTLNRSINSGDAPAPISANSDTLANSEKTDAEKKKEAEDANKTAKESKEKAQAQSEESKQRTGDIADKIKNQEKRAHANAAFASWQRRMEEIQIRAGKRNIVNTYVWDADGGLRIESQSFASTSEHSIGGSFNMGAALGSDIRINAGGLAVELTAQATMQFTQTMSKQLEQSRGLELNVDLSGVENIGITDFKDNPVLPGEKVDRYRFMSFYLEGKTDHFHDFFSKVVDPEWLASNDEEARALRQTQTGPVTAPWRVLHRVTYVERPALQGFGQSSYQPEAAPTSERRQITAKISALEAANRELEKKLDRVLSILEPK